MEVFRRVREVAAVHEATIFGRDIHVVVNAETTPQQLASALHVDADRIAAITPSLEDAFVALTRESQK
jgi:hypothetical protein